MTNHAPRFSDLEGVGEESELAFREAGIDSWARLARILAAVADLSDRGPERLRSLASQAEDRAADVDELSDCDERRESFIVQIAIGKDAVPIRSSVADARSSDVPLTRWGGWEPTELIELIESTFSEPQVVDETVASGNADSERPEGSDAPTTTKGGQEGKEREERGEGEDRQEPPPVSGRPPTRRSPFEVGTVLGRGPHTVELALVSAQLGELDGICFDYRVTLICQLLGESESFVLQEIGCRHLGQSRLVVNFTGVETPLGVNRLKVQVTAPKAPTLALEAAD